MKSAEDVIYDAITNSAKSKFDFKSFQESFGDLPEHVSENFLFAVLCGLASQEELDIVTSKLMGQIMAVGLYMDPSELQKFLEDKAQLLKLEIYLTGLSRDMIDDGTNPLQVLEMVNKMLN